MSARHTSLRMYDAPAATNLYTFIFSNGVRYTESGVTQTEARRKVDSLLADLGLFAVWSVAFVLNNNRPEAIAA